MIRRHGSLACLTAQWRSLLVTVISIGLLAPVALAPAAYGSASPRPGRTERVSVASDGSEGTKNGFSNLPSISADGRYVAFTSFAPNLVPGDNNDFTDLFVRDRQTGIVQRVSVATTGAEANGGPNAPTISADGRYVAWQSRASNLVPGDTNTAGDVFVHDRETGETERVSVASDGTQGNNESLSPSLSADGRYVAFESWASNLVPGDTNGIADILVHDRVTGTTERVSVASDGSESTFGKESLAPSISGDGRYVTFHGPATNLVPGDTNGARDVFVHDREDGVTQRISIASDSTQGTSDSTNSSISGDGRYVAFQSDAANLVPADTNGDKDVFVHDRETGVTRRVSVTSDGVEGNDASFVSKSSISSDGRSVAFHSWASNLVPGDTNTGSGLGRRFDVFVHDQETGMTERVSVASDGSEANHTSTIPSISADGHFVAFESSASNLVPGDTNETSDVFVRDRGPGVGIGNLQASASGDEVSVSGWATFTGGVVSSANDPATDGTPEASQLGAELTRASVAYRHEQGDVLVRLRVTGFPGTRPPAAGPTGAPGVVYGLRFAVGQSAYEIRALSVGATGAPPATPFFALYGCAPVCAQQATLAGGFGTTGEEVVVSLPLAAIEGNDGGTLSGLVAFSGRGEAATGSVSSLDEITLPDALLPPARVALGIAPVGTPESDVAFDTTADLSDGTFSGSLDASALEAGDYDVWARACLGDDCGAASTRVNTGSEASPLPTPTESPTTEPTPTPSPSPTEPMQTFTREGTILAFSPVAGGGVTENEFLAGCEVPHDTQGFDGYVFEIPPGFTSSRRGDASAAVVGSNDLDSYDLDLVFYAKDCRFLSRSAKADRDETAKVPAVARFVVVNAFDGHETDFVLTITAPAASTSPPCTPTPPPSEPRTPPQTDRVSVATNGAQANSHSIFVSMSSDARFVAFQSTASNLVAGDTNGAGDVFVSDRESGTTERVSVGPGGVQSNGGSFNPSISADGRYVAFSSIASNIVQDDTAGSDVFVHDLETGITQRVSISSDGAAGNAASNDPAISGDGRYVAFISSASNLVPGDANGFTDAFVHDRVTGATSRVSVSSDGAEGNRYTHKVSISLDGRYVAFYSEASNLVPGDTNRKQGEVFTGLDAFVHDRQTATTERVSVASDESEANGNSFVSAAPSLSADGRHVTFYSQASNLVPGDTNDDWPLAGLDVFVRDREAGITERVSVASDCTEGNSHSQLPTITPDGRYVAFDSQADNLVPDDTNYDPSRFNAGQDVFVHDRDTGITERVSVSSGGAEGNRESIASALSADGRHVAFQSWASNLVSGDTNGTYDIYVRDRGGPLTVAPPRARGSYPTDPNDPHWGDSTAVTDFEPVQWAPKLIEASEAWQEERATGFDIRVAVLDSGVDLQHEDLQCAGKLDVVANSDPVANDSDPNDENSHGTHVAGIIGACTNNGKGVAGVAPDTTIVPIRVLNADGQGNDDQLIAGINRAVAAGAHVINVSLGYLPGKDIIEDVSDIDAAIEAAADAGIVLVGAAGNDGAPLCDYPALAEDIICVGATDTRDLKAWYSNFPVKPTGPALVAPGGSGAPFCDTYTENVLSTIPRELDTDGCTDIQGYGINSGTSMAAPHVSGVAALVYDRVGGTRSADNAQTVVDAILSSAEDLGLAGYDPVFGEGRVNAFAAVCAVGTACGGDPDPSESPTTDPSESPTTDPSESPTTDPTPTVPEAPSNLTARAASSSRIELAWADNSSSETRFAIERSLDGDDWREIATAGRNATKHLDMGLDPDTTYYYRVRALNQSGYSPYSNAASATTLPEHSQDADQAPSAPSNLNATSSSPSRIDLSWNDNSNNEDGFAIERSSDGTTWQEISTTGRNQATYLDSGLTANTTYHYRVRAYNSAGHSVYSAATSATTQEMPSEGEPSPTASDSPVESVATGTATTSIEASRTITKYRKGFEVSGVVERDDNCTGPLEVAVSRRIHGTNSYESVASTPVNGAGNWGLQVIGRRNASYIAQVKKTDTCEGDPSVPTDVLVRAKISVRVPTVCRGPVRGKVLPRYRGSEVVLQRRFRGRWNEVAIDTLDVKSRFVLRAKKCGVHRVAWSHEGVANEPAKLRFRL